MKVQNNYASIEVKGVFDGLNDLEKDYMSKELRKQASRTTSELQAAAKKRARKHMIREIIIEAVTVLKMVGFVGAGVAIALAYLSMTM